jgi:hypothetical protein
MRISFDMDGVLADMDTALASLAEQEFGTSERPASAAPERPSAATGEQPATAQQAETGEAAAPPQPDLPSAAILERLTSRQQTRLWKRVGETRNFWEGLAEHEPGAVRRLQRLAHDLRWDVLFVTQRPGTTGRTTQLQTQHWLRRHGFEYPAVYTTQGSRGKIAAALTLDAHVDDRLNNAMDIATESKAWSILVWRDAMTFDRISAAAARFGIATVRTVNEAMDKIEAAHKDTAGEEPTTLLGRLKRAFGGR